MTPTRTVFKTSAISAGILAVFAFVYAYIVSSKGWRIEYRGSERTVVDGPFPETKELIAGFTIIDVASRDAALAWSKRYPKPHLTDGSIEVRQIYELEDFAGADVERFKELERKLDTQREAK